MARVKALKKPYGKDDDSRFVDAAKYTRRRAHSVIVVNRDGKELKAATIGTGDTDSAEEVALALATATGRERVVVLTDSQAACRNCQKGRISVVALNILGKIENPPEIFIIWTPGRESLAGNAAADTRPENTLSGHPRRANEP